MLIFDVLLLILIFHIPMTITTTKYQIRLCHCHHLLHHLIFTMFIRCYTHLCSRGKLDTMIFTLFLQQHRPSSSWTTSSSRESPSRGSWSNANPVPQQDDCHTLQERHHGNAGDTDRTVNDSEYLDPNIDMPYVSRDPTQQCWSGNQGKSTKVGTRDGR